MTDRLASILLDDIYIHRYLGDHKLSSELTLPRILALTLSEIQASLHWMYNVKVYRVKYKNIDYSAWGTS